MKVDLFLKELNKHLTVRELERKGEERETKIEKERDVSAIFFFFFF